MSDKYEKYYSYNWRAEESHAHYSSTACSDQKILVTIKWADNVDENRRNQIYADIQDKGWMDISDALYDMLGANNEDCDFLEIKNDDIIFKTRVFDADVKVISYGNDWEGPECEFTYEGFPSIDTPCPERAKVIENIMNYFKEQGWNEIIDIEIDSYEADEEKFYEWLEEYKN